MSRIDVKRPLRIATVDVALAEGWLVGRTFVSSTRMDVRAMTKTPGVFCSTRVADMNQRMTALERAFQLARSGQVSTVSEIKTSLARDGYSINQLDGPALRRQLVVLIRASRLDDVKAHGL